MGARAMGQTTTVRSAAFAGTAGVALLMSSALSFGCTTTKPAPDTSHEPGWAEATRPTDELDEKRYSRSLEDPAKDLEGRLTAQRRGPIVAWELSLTHAPAGPLVLDLYRGVSCADLSAPEQSKTGSVPLGEALAEVTANADGQATASGETKVQLDAAPGGAHEQSASDDGSAGETDEETEDEIDAYDGEPDDDMAAASEAPAEPGEPAVLGAVIVRSADAPPMLAAPTLAPRGFGCFDLPVPGAGASRD